MPVSKNQTNFKTLFSYGLLLKYRMIFKHWQGKNMSFTHLISLLKARLVYQMDYKFKDRAGCLEIKNVIK